MIRRWKSTSMCSSRNTENSSARLYPSVDRRNYFLGASLHQRSLLKAKLSIAPNASSITRLYSSSSRLFIDCVSMGTAAAAAAVSGSSGASGLRVRIFRWSTQSTSDVSGLDLRSGSSRTGKTDSVSMRPDRRVRSGAKTGAESWDSGCGIRGRETEERRPRVSLWPPSLTCLE